MRKRWRKKRQVQKKKREEVGKKGGQQREKGKTRVLGSTAGGGKKAEIGIFWERPVPILKRCSPLPGGLSQGSREEEKE